MTLATAVCTRRVRLFRTLRLTFTTGLCEVRVFLAYNTKFGYYHFFSFPHKEIDLAASRVLREEPRYTGVT